VAADDQRDYWAEGIALFNKGRFFECHEVWEEIWKRAGGEEKTFCQGVIQAAVAILHAQRGNLRGSESIWRKALAKLEKLPRHYAGIELDALRGAVDEFITSAVSGHPSTELPKICRTGRREE
jgi:uncharacterized protein